MIKVIIIEDEVLIAERLKKMIHSGKIEEGHELSNEELLKLGNGKV